MVNNSSFEPQISESHAFLPFLQEIIATVQTCLIRSSRADIKKKKKKLFNLSLAKPRYNAQNNNETLSAIYLCTHITSHCHFVRKSVMKRATHFLGCELNFL